MLIWEEYYCIAPGGYMLDKELGLVFESERLNPRLC